MPAVLCPIPQHLQVVVYYSLQTGKHSKLVFLVSVSFFDPLNLAGNADQDKFGRLREVEVQPVSVR